MSGWSEEVVEQLKALADQGLSASQACSHFEGMSRNSAVGLAHRRKFHFHCGPSGGHRGGNRRKPVAVVVAEPVILEPTRLGMLTLIELISDSCRWPYGDPRDQDFRYCGQRQVSAYPYCLEHKLLSYETPEQRRARV